MQSPCIQFYNTILEIIYVSAFCLNSVADEILIIPKSSVAIFMLEDVTLLLYRLLILQSLQFLFDKTKTFNNRIDSTRPV